MTSFLLEIYGEEIPSWAQRQAENQLMILFKEFLQLIKFYFQNFNLFNIKANFLDNKKNKKQSI